MDRERHITQDAAEHYAVYLMAKTAENLGVSARFQSKSLWESFIVYLKERGWRFEEDFATKYPDYKINVDYQIPSFVERLIRSFPESNLEFSIDEAAFRNMGMKADFTVHIENHDNPFYVSLKNYTGAGGVSRPQVSSGTFLSFAAGFVFERQGVGTYVNPQAPDNTFSASIKEKRDSALIHLGKVNLIPHFDVLEDLQQFVRNELLGLRFYDQREIRKVIEHIVPKGQEAILEIFSLIGEPTVRMKLLERVGLDGVEDILFFDKELSVDSITNRKFHDLCKALNSPETNFAMRASGQSLSFNFHRGEDELIQVDVPLTINTNGAWHRPKERYEGKRVKIDKGHKVLLAWGEIRPHKSKEIATSTNSYLNLKATGVLG
jgi:hypothetical protein